MTNINFDILPLDASFLYRHELITAIELAKTAGALLLDMHEQGPQRIDKKLSESDIVTEADIASQRLILHGLTSRFPQHGILAEETGGDQQGESGALWLVDPLDGTTNFSVRLPMFSVSIALRVENKPQIGVIQDVTRKHTYWAATGQGAWRGTDRRLRVSATSRLDQSVIGSGFAHDRAVNTDNNVAEFGYLAQRLRGIRRHGSAALDLAWVAEGRLDGFWEAGLSPWDWGAGALLIEEAGGKVSDYWGHDMQPEGKQLAVSNGNIHKELLAVLQQLRQNENPTAAGR